MTPRRLLGWMRAPSAQALNDRSPPGAEAALGRIQPFLARGTFEPFGHTAQDIGQTTLFRPKPSSEGLLTECHLGVRAAQVPQKLSPFPRHARVGKEPRISLHAAETRASAGFLASREPLQGREFSPR